MFSTIFAKHAGTCKRCGKPFDAGTKIRYGGQGRTYHFVAECPATVKPEDQSNGEPIRVSDNANG